MQSEQQWFEAKGSGDDYAAAETYQYFMRPEPREDMSEIFEVEDDYLGKVPCRELRIGMVRNAKEDMKKVVIAFLKPFPHIRIDKAKELQGWYKGLYEEPAKRNRPCFTEAILTEPYGGYCAVGCAFCYINSGFRGYRGTGLITVPLNYGKQVKNQLQKMRRGAAGYFSSFTDPFTPLEQYYHNTEEAAKEFVSVGLPIFFLSRLKYPEWAIALLKENKHSYAQKSINTGNAADYRRLSPGALGYEEHLEDIARLRREGIYVSIQVNPIVPGVTSPSDIYRLFKDLAKVGTNHVIVKFVEAGYSWAPAMIERMEKLFGERGTKFRELFTDNMGGEKSVEEKYRLDCHKMFRKWATEVGMTYATCYEYAYDRDDQGNVTSKVGHSIGREFTTASQCHGHAVPVYSRLNDKELFQPLEECPPSGCLYCASENDGKARCGDELAGEAHAVRMADLKAPIGQGKGRAEKELIQLGIRGI